MLERSLACKSLNQVVVATTNAPEDTAVLAIAEKFGVSTFTGSQDDVLDRYYQAAKAYSVDVVVRITADCPLLDPGEVDRVVCYFLTHPRYDYVATGETYPEGYGAEVFSRAALEKTWREADLTSEREHVTPYIWKHPDRFRVERLELPEDLSKFRVTVDEESDMLVVSALVDALAPSDPFFGIDSAVAFLKAHPEIASLNSHITRLAGYWKSLVEDRIVKESP
jgi:spore coat polysaccharide biosynthesis protein SpsF